MSPTSPAVKEARRVAKIFEMAWWVIALRGALAVVLGVVTLTWPHITLRLLLTVVGTYMFLDGVLAFVATFRASGEGRGTWWPYLLEGISGVAVGLLALARPEAFMFAVVVLMGLRTAIAGFAELRAASALRRELGKPLWALGLAGVVTMAVGVVMILHPTFGVMALVWLFGLQTLTFGALLVAAAFSAKGAGRRLVSRPA